MDYFDFVNDIWKSSLIMRHNITLADDFCIVCISDNEAKRCFLMRMKFQGKNIMPFQLNSDLNWKI